MDLTLFFIIIVVIIFIYYLINVIKDLQIQIQSLSSTNNNIKPTETIDVKIKTDIVYLLDFIKNYFI